MAFLPIFARCRLPTTLTPPERLPKFPRSACLTAKIQENLIVARSNRCRWFPPGCALSKHSCQSFKEMDKVASGRKRRIAVVGSGISGLGAAHILGPVNDVTLYEADNRLGGHTNTVSVDDPVAGPLGVDTGFIVHNDRNYPLLCRLFRELNVETQASEMSFSVTDKATELTYRATNPITLLARPANALDRRWWRMLVDIARFYRHGRRFLTAPDPSVTIGELLRQGRYSEAFIDLHLVPMGAAVWSTSPVGFLDYPAATLLRFLENHGLLSVGNRPNWRTVTGGSRTYVDAITARFDGTILMDTPVTEIRRIRTDEGGVSVRSKAGVETFDHVVLACHSQRAAELIADRSATEDRLLRSIEFQPNRAVLHTDTSVLSPYERAWAAWNCHVDTGQSADGLSRQPARLTYDLTELQRLPGRHRYLVTLNPDPAEPLDGVLAEFDYEHPRFDLRAINGQDRLAEIDGIDGLSFCGAWRGYGFHEDGLASAVAACRRLGSNW